MNNNININTYEIEALDAAAEAAYDGDFGARMAWFKARSTEELTALWSLCRFTDVNPFGRAYDDEVFDALAARGHFSA